MDETQRAYVAHRVAIRAAAEAYQKELGETLKLYGTDLDKLYGTSHQHNAAILLNRPKDMVVPVVLSVHFGGACEMDVFEKLCVRHGWDKRLVINGEEQKLD